MDTAAKNIHRVRTACLAAESAQSWKKLTRIDEDRFWQLATDALSPQDAKALAEDLGVEWDSPEHVQVEQSPLCVEKKSLKRKRC
jgi:hypothetical protein